MRYILIKACYIKCGPNIYNIINFVSLDFGLTLHLKKTLSLNIFQLIKREYLAYDSEVKCQVGEIGHVILIQTALKL